MLKYDQERKKQENDLAFPRERCESNGTVFGVTEPSVTSASGCPFTRPFPTGEEKEENNDSYGKKNPEPGIGSRYDLLHPGYDGFCGRNRRGVPFLRNL